MRRGRDRGAEILERYRAWLYSQFYVLSDRWPGSHDSFYRTCTFSKWYAMRVRYEKIPGARIIYEMGLPLAPLKKLPRRTHNRKQLPDE